MKRYIGTKQIEAEPMTMGEAYERGFLKAGYNVRRVIWEEGCFLSMVSNVLNKY